MKKSWILIFLSIISCSIPDDIEFKKVLGKFSSEEEAKDYTHLELRRDSTYDFNQARYYSCDLWVHYSGNWTIENNQIVLYEGINLDRFIDVQYKNNFKSDTLKIIFTKEFLIEFPNIKVKIGKDSLDTNILNQEILLDKKQYFIENKLFKDSVFNEISNYQDYFLKLDIRAGKFYQTFHNILEFREIKIGIGSFENNLKKAKKIIEYNVYNKNLQSQTTPDWMNSHQLKKAHPN